MASMTTKPGKGKGGKAYVEQNTKNAWAGVIRDATNYLTKGGLQTDKRTKKAMKDAGVK